MSLVTTTQLSHELSVLRAQLGNAGSSISSGNTSTVTTLTQIIDAITYITQEVGTGYVTKSELNALRDAIYKGQAAQDQEIDELRTEVEVLRQQLRNTSTANGNALTELTHDSSSAHTVVSGTLGGSWSHQAMRIDFGTQFMVIWTMQYNLTAGGAGSTTHRVTCPNSLLTRRNNADGSYIPSANLKVHTMALREKNGAGNAVGLVVGGSGGTIDYGITASGAGTTSMTATAYLWLEEDGGSLFAIPSLSQFMVTKVNTFRETGDVRLTVIPRQWGGPTGAPFDGDAKIQLYDPSGLVSTTTMTYSGGIYTLDMVIPADSKMYKLQPIADKAGNIKNIDGTAYSIMRNPVIGVDIIPEIQYSPFQIDSPLDILDFITGGTISNIVLTLKDKLGNILPDPAQYIIDAVPTWPIEFVNDVISTVLPILLSVPSPATILLSLGMNMLPSLLDAVTKGKMPVFTVLFNISSKAQQIAGDANPAQVPKKIGSFVATFPAFEFAGDLLEGLSELLNGLPDIGLPDIPNPF